MLHEVRYGSDLYRRMTWLREEVLRLPLGLVQTADDLRGEEDQIHIAALDGDAVVGTVLLKPGSPPLIKLRQMAVAATAQGTGLGTALVRFAEALAREKGFGEVALNARLAATGFYERLGYCRHGEVFLEIGLPHIEMRRSIGYPPAAVSQP